MNFMGIGGFELVVIGLIAFLLFGAKGMQDGVKTVGKVMKDLRGQGNELRQMVARAVEEEEDEKLEKTAPRPQGAVARPTGALPGLAAPAQAIPTHGPGQTEAGAGADALPQRSAAPASGGSPPASPSGAAAAPGRSGDART
jgi:Sec-independent protein translocase protein TatA